MKTITTTTGEKFTLDFYCERRRAHMTRIGCERMQAAAKQQAKRGRKTVFSAVSTTPPDENPCLDCPQGREIRNRNHALAADGTNAKKSARCCWPGCNDPVHSTGLCARHHRQWKRNALIKLNTTAAGPAAARDFLQRLAKMTADAGMPVEDVALAALDEGIKVYFERVGRSSKLKAER